MSDTPTEILTNVGIWHIRAGGMALKPNDKAPQLLRLNICEDVGIVLNRDADDTALQAEAMRELAGLASQAAEDLEGHIAGEYEPEWDSEDSNAYQDRVEAGLEPEDDDG